MQHTLNTLKENPIVYTGIVESDCHFYKEFSKYEYSLKKLEIAGKVYIPKIELCNDDTDKNIALKKFKKHVANYLKSQKIPQVYLSGYNNIPVIFCKKKALSLFEQVKHLDNECPAQWKKKTAYTQASNGKWYKRTECQQGNGLRHSNCGAPLDKDTCLRRNAIRTIRKTKQVEVLKVETSATPDRIKIGRKIYINK